MIVFVSFVDLQPNCAISAPELYVRTVFFRDSSQLPRLCFSRFDPRTQDKAGIVRVALHRPHQPPSNTVRRSYMRTLVTVPEFRQCGPLLSFLDNAETETPSDKVPCGRCAAAQGREL